MKKKNESIHQEFGRFTRDEIKQMMRNAGLENIRFSDSKPFWVAVGFKSDKNSNA